MCLDIIIQKSNGEGILDLMQKLSSEYGFQNHLTTTSFFAKITLTYPE
jgi:hypothetical protein